MPPSTHTASISGALGTRTAIAAGVLKIPEPIVMPMTMPIELQKPSLRLRRALMWTGVSLREDRHRTCSRPPEADAKCEVSAKWRWLAVGRRQGAEQWIDTSL